MKIFNTITDFISNKKTIVTIGTFDGVHVGHRKIITKLVNAASASDSESVILTFFPHPRMVLDDGSEIRLLNTMEEKIRLLESAGLENIIIHPFDKEFSNLTAEEFVQNILVRKLRIAEIIIGHDHRFGQNRSAGIHDLAAFGRKYGFRVTQIPAEEIDAISVSSTKIRTALINGNINLANQYLGYNYMLSGIVIQGKKLGRTIGFPTANLNLSDSSKLIPKMGVYVVSGILKGVTVFGMMNIGIKPTVGETPISIEIHFFDFDEDIYGHPVTVSVLHHMREERKFESVELLSKQLVKDKINAIEFLKHI